MGNQQQIRETVDQHMAGVTVLSSDRNRPKNDGGPWVQLRIQTWPEN